jgi:hypothetical protein
VINGWASGAPVAHPHCLHSIETGPFGHEFSY